MTRIYSTVVYTDSDDYICTGLSIQEINKNVMEKLVELGDAYANANDVEIQWNNVKETKNLEKMADFLEQFNIYVELSF
jgi:hypothetical protein